MYKKKGFTLAEVLIAMSLFTVVAVIAAGMLVDIVQLHKRSSIHNPLYHDARIIMQQLSKLVQSGTIDYEEYYSIKVVQGKQYIANKLPSGGPYYGINGGVYSSRFFDPGKRNDGVDAANPADLGIECSYRNVETQECEIYFSDSSDLNTGQNPYKGNASGYQADAANAFCDEAAGGIKCANTSDVTNELYLIDSSGKHKTILGLRQMTDTACANDGDCAIGMVKMSGRDLDQNGVVDVFSCDENYNCAAKDGVNISDAFKYPFIVNCAALGTCGKPNDYLIANGVSLPQQADLSASFKNDTSQFIPITPKSVNVKALAFKINPLDDPYRAYAETAMQTQPTVTIIMTLGLSAVAKADYPGNFPDITLQTTVAAGVIGKIDSYPPVNDVLNSGETSWIYKVMN